MGNSCVIKDSMKCDKELWPGLNQAATILLFLKR